jgi:hypothetical protein
MICSHAAPARRPGKRCLLCLLSAVTRCGMSILTAWLPASTTAQYMPMLLCYILSYTLDSPLWSRTSDHPSR